MQGCERRVTCPQEACHLVNLVKMTSYKHIHEALTTQVFRRREDLCWTLRTRSVLKGQKAGKEQGLPGRRKGVSKGTEVGKPKAGLKKSGESGVCGAEICVGDWWEVRSAGSIWNAQAFPRYCLTEAISLSWPGQAGAFVSALFRSVCMLCTFPSFMMAVVCQNWLAFLCGSHLLSVRLLVSPACWFQ